LERTKAPPSGGVFCLYITALELVIAVVNIMTISRMMREARAA
jgi:hypothetical protein